MPRNAQHQRRKRLGEKFSHNVLDAKEEKSRKPEFKILLATPELLNAEHFGKHETTTDLNLNISQPNNFDLWGG